MYNIIDLHTEIEYTCKNKINCECNHPLCRCLRTATCLLMISLQNGRWLRSKVDLRQLKSSKIALPRWVCVHFSGIWRSRMQKKTSEIEFSANFESTHVVPTFYEIKKLKNSNVFGKILRKLMISHGIVTPLAACPFK